MAATEKDRDIFHIRDLPIEAQEKLIYAGWQLDQNIDAWNQGGDFGNTPLIRSIQIQDMALCKLLLEKGAKPDRKNYAGDLPIWEAFVIDRDRMYRKNYASNLPVHDPYLDENRYLNGEKLHFISEDRKCEAFITSRTIFCMILEKIDLKHDEFRKMVYVLLSKIRDAYRYQRVAPEHQSNLPEVAKSYPLEGTLSIIPNSICIKGGWGLQKNSSTIIVPLNNPNSGFALICAAIYQKLLRITACTRFELRRNLRDVCIDVINSIIVDYAFDPMEIFISYFKPDLKKGYPNYVYSWLLNYARICHAYHEAKKLAQKGADSNVEAKALSESHVISRATMIPGQALASVPSPFSPASERLAASITNLSVAVPTTSLLQPDKPEAGTGNDSARKTHLTQFETLSRKRKGAAEVPTTSNKDRPNLLNPKFSFTHPLRFSR